MAKAKFQKLMSNLKEDSATAYQDYYNGFFNRNAEKNERIERTKDMYEREYARFKREAKIISLQRQLENAKKLGKQPDIDGLQDKLDLEVERFNREFKRKHPTEYDSLDKLDLLRTTFTEQTVIFGNILDTAKEIIALDEADRYNVAKNSLRIAADVTTDRDANPVQKALISTKAIKNADAAVGSLNNKDPISGEIMKESQASDVANKQIEAANQQIERENQRHEKTIQNLEKRKQNYAKVKKAATNTNTQTQQVVTEGNINKKEQDEAEEEVVTSSQKLTPVNSRKAETIEETDLRKFDHYQAVPNLTKDPIYRADMHSEADVIELFQKNEDGKMFYKLIAKGDDSPLGRALMANKEVETCIELGKEFLKKADRGTLDYKGYINAKATKYKFSRIYYSTKEKIEKES